MQAAPAIRCQVPSAMRCPASHHPVAPPAWRRLALAMLAACALAACAPMPATVDDHAVAPSLPAAPGQVLQDLRAPYRQVLCRRLAADAGACATPLRRLAGEPAPLLQAPAPVDRAVLARRYRIAFVPGLLAECFDRLARPFGDAEQSLQAANAQRIASRTRMLETFARLSTAVGAGG